MSLSQYASRLLVRQLLGERDHAQAACDEFSGVVLFVDIVDSTGMTDRFAAVGRGGAERLADILNRYFGGVIDLVDSHLGDTVRIDGDAVIALWRQGPECEAPADLAAAAALAVQREFRDWRPAEDVTMRQRLTLVSGRLRAIRFSDGADRRFFVLAGEPFNQLGASTLRGEPDQIILSDTVAHLLKSRARLEKTSSGALKLVSLRDDCGGPNVIGVGREVGRVPAASLETADSLVRGFLPRVVVDRTEAGQDAWLAEFRTLSVAYVNLTGLELEGSGSLQRLQNAVCTIRDVVHPLGVAVSDVVASEKGFIVIVACGLPPFAQENNAVRAVEAARRIRPALARIGMNTAIGVTTGHAFCGDVGSTRRREYLSIGSVMSYAARLMQMASGEILCDGPTARAARDQLVFSDPELLRVKGRVELLPVHRLQEVRRLRPRNVAAPTALFGREEELQILTERLDGLGRGVGGLVAIEAEAGAGKSHLLGHVADAARARGHCTVICATSPIEQMTPYYTFREILPQLLLRPNDPPATPALLRARLAEAVQDDALAPKVALLEDILPLDLPDKGLARDITGPARLSGIEELMTRIAERLTATAPVVVLLDDLHWIDASSAMLLAAMARRVPRLLVGLTTRPPDDTSTTQMRNLLNAASPRVRLPRLQRDAIIKIACERLGVHGIPAQLAEFLQTRSEGLPFYAEQLVLALREQGVLVAVDGRCRLSVIDLSAVVVPDTVRDLIISRVDRLAPDHQLTVKVASAIGPVFEAETLCEIHPLKSNVPALEGILGELVRAGMLSRNPGAEPAVYAFRHVIIQGVTYELLTYAQRRPLHQRIARYLERRHAGALEPHYAALAEHWERADEAESAIGYRIGAANLASRRYANEDALNHIDRIDRLAARCGIILPLRQRAECTRIRADVCQELTRFDEANRHFRNLAALSGIKVPTTRARMSASFAGEAAAQTLRRFGIIRTVSRNAALDRDRLAAHIHIRFAEHAYFANDTLGLAYGTLASLNRAERAQSVPEIVNGCGGLALGLAALGLHRWAHFYRDRSIALAATAGSLPARGYAELLACVHSFHTGDWQRMDVHGARGAEIWKQLGDHYRHQCCLVLQGYRLIAVGHYPEAERALLVFGEQAQQIESPQVRAWALAALAILDLLLGRSPATALARLAPASRDGDLHSAERLLCVGIEAAVHLEAGSFQEALHAAEEGLENMLRSSPAMAGALMFSVPTIAEVLLALADRPTLVGQSRRSLLIRAEAACRVAQYFAARNRICRPRAALLHGRLAGARGRSRRAIACWRRALIEAERLGLPLEQAVSHLALAAGSDVAADRDEHRQRADEIMRRLGAVSSVWARAWGELSVGDPHGGARRA